MFTRFDPLLCWNLKFRYYNLTIEFKKIVQNLELAVDVCSMERINARKLDRLLIIFD